MMVLFLNAARLALVVFDPYLLQGRSPKLYCKRHAGQLIADNQYYTFSSVFFYTNRRALLLNGRVNNLEYGSYAPGAPDVFIDDDALCRSFGERPSAIMCLSRSLRWSDLRSLSAARR